MVLGIRTLTTPIVLALALFLGLSGCGAASPAKDRRGQVDGTAFELSTGGTDLTDEYGQWTVRIRGDAMWVARFRSGKAEEFGPFTLNGGESSKLWGYVEDARLHKRPEGADYGKETPVYALTILRPKKLAHTYNVRVKDAAKDVEIDDLVRYVAKLVKKYTKKKVVMTAEQYEKARSDE